MNKIAVDITKGLPEPLDLRKIEKSLHTKDNPSLNSLVFVPEMPPKELPRYAKPSDPMEGEI